MVAATPTRNWGWHPRGFSGLDDKRVPLALELHSVAASGCHARSESSSGYRTPLEAHEIATITVVLLLVTSALKNDQ